MTELTFGSGDNDVMSMEQRITQSLDLTFDVVSVSNAGEYTCGAIVEDSMGESIQVMSNFTLFVESKLIINVLFLALKIIRPQNYSTCHLHVDYSGRMFLLHVQLHVVYY